MSDGQGDASGTMHSGSSTAEDTAAPTGSSSSSSTGPDDLCGNEQLDDGEQCDDGNDDNTDDCVEGCVAATCGDGHQWVDNEECDDGNDDNTDGCVEGCVLAACGDGYVHDGVEACDDANEDETDDCISNCQGAACGDGYLQADVEACDDGNAMTGDGCDDECEIELGERVVFVSSQEYDGNLGGLDGADDLCQGLADDAGLAGTFRAWLGDGDEGPADRFIRSPDAYVRTDGTMIAADWDDLVDGMIDAPISLTEAEGAPPTGNTTCNGGGESTAWTNVNANGTTNTAHCDGWTNAGGSGARWGYTTETSADWTDACSGVGPVCASVSPIYCFQQ
jgi:cysteine-rich repeat protein